MPASYALRETRVVYMNACVDYGTENRSYKQFVKWD